MIEQTIEDNDGIIFTVYEDPVIQTAMEILEKFNKSKIVILRGKGKTIPNTVAVANIITENFLKNNSKINKIQVDSEIPNDGRMISNIEIIIEKNN